MPDASLRGLRIAIASTGRFHVLDLARELRARGHDVRFYAHVPPRRAEAYGLSAESVVSLTLPAAPFLALKRYLPKLAPTKCKRMYFGALNRAVIRKLEHCDIFICMSGVYLEAAKYAREAFGAKIFLERGSTHVDTQHTLMGSDPHTLPKAAALTRMRELAGYAMADRIVLPARHVADSFQRDPVAHAKTVTNPYGVDLGLFTLRTKTLPLRRKLLFVGAWSRRKGVDYLVDMVRRLPGAVLTHVGSLGDLPFPLSDPQFVHFEPVDQSELPQFYHDADLMVMMSREEGLALVQLQALACGLPLVASARTGAASLIVIDAGLEKWVRVHEVGDVDSAVADATFFFNALKDGTLPTIEDVARERLSWAAYGERYESAIFDALGHGSL